MPDRALPFDTTPYDRLPISTILCEPALDPDGTVRDYRIVYGNEVFARDWRRLCGDEAFVGSSLVRAQILDDSAAMEMIARFQASPPQAFTTFVERKNLHLHFQPLTDLPEPYVGFFLTNITDYEEQEARVHFLCNIRQMKNSAVLFKRHEDNRLEAVFASEEFARMMECKQEDALAMMDGAGFLQSTHPEDRPLVRSMLRRRVSDEGGNVLTIQKYTFRHNPIWCNVHCTFIDDFNEHYIYCTYYDVTTLKEYEERLRTVYISMGNSFYQETERTLGLFRVNVTQDSIEDVKGRDLFRSDALGRSYTEAMGLRAVHYPIWRPSIAATSSWAMRRARSPSPGSSAPAARTGASSTRSSPPTSPGTP